LLQALRVVEGVRGIAVVRLEASDVVRHPLVARIIGAYQREDRRIEEDALRGS
jgi:phosphate starvation-inducible PhoH-like protein